MRNSRHNSDIKNAIPFSTYETTLSTIYPLFYVKARCMEVSPPMQHLPVGGPSFEPIVYPVSNYCTNAICK